MGDIHFSSGNAPSFLALSGSFSREDGQENALSKKLPLPAPFVCLDEDKPASIVERAIWLALPLSTTSLNIGEERETKDNHLSFACGDTSER